MAGGPIDSAERKGQRDFIDLAWWLLFALWPSFEHDVWN